MSIAYVIMPYAKEYERVYRNLIKPAVEQCDMVCKRTDKDSNGGHVISSVIHDLTENDVVIADISGCNWNVAYELGIRHAMCQKGTIILCNDSTQFPFDISGYDIINYATDWLDLDLDDEIIDKIVSRIKKIRSGETVSDSPVHDIYPSLPNTLLQFLNTADDTEQKQIQQLQTEIDKLREKNKALQERIEQAGLDTEKTKQQSASTESLILEAIENGKYISDTAVNALRELLDDGKKEDFARYLSKVLDVGYLDESDCRSVYYMCRKLDNPTIVRIFLESAVEFYPDSEELQGFLADTYSNDYRTRDRALSMANSMIGLSIRNGNKVLEKKVRSSRMIASFFNVYISLKLYKEMVEVGYLLLEGSPSHKSLIRRNLIVAYQKLEQYDKADEIAKALVEDDPMEGLNHYRVFQLHAAKHEYFAAYRELEKSLACDSEDTDYYEGLASIICDQRIARNAAGEYIRIQTSEKEYYAAPFIICAILASPDYVNDAAAFLRRNRFTNTLQRLISCIQNGDGNLRNEFSDLDFTPVYACMDVDCTGWETE